MICFRDFAACAASFCLVSTSACSSSDSPGNGPGAQLECTPAATPSSESGFSLKPFCSPKDPGRGNIWFAASGEVLALTGYAFPPASDEDAAFVDGWDVTFTRLLTTIDTITLSDNPDSVPGDESRSATRRPVHRCRPAGSSAAPRPAR